MTCSYYQGFIHNLLEVARPLIRLTRKFIKFEWTKEFQAAFELLKELLTTAPVLAYPDISELYLPYTDGCIGACLTEVQ